MKDSINSVAVNIWKEIRKDLKDHLINFEDALLILHDYNDFKNIVDLMNYIPKTDISYVSMTKTYLSIKRYSSKINHYTTVVDTVTPGLSDQELLDKNDCMYRAYPSSLSALLALIEEICIKRPKYIIVDSLSQITTFSSDNRKESLLSFSDKIKDICSQYKCKIILLYDIQPTEKLKRLPVLSFDPIIRIESINEVVNWID